MRRFRRLQDRCQNMIAPGGRFCAKSLAAETKIRTVSSCLAPYGASEIFNV
jgi:hypothetical protein